MKYFFKIFYPLCVKCIFMDDEKSVRPAASRSHCSCLHSTCAWGKDICQERQSRKLDGSSRTLEDLHFLARGFESDMDNKL